LEGQVACDIQTTSKKLVGAVKLGNLVLNVISVQSTDEKGQITTSHALTGTISFLECDAKGTCTAGPPLNVIGVVDSSGALIAAFWSKKGYDYYQAKSSLSIGVTGRITFKAKEGATLTARGNYIGHVTIVK